MKIEEILNLVDRSEAYIELARLYIVGADDIRVYIVKEWDFGVDWKLPNQARLACKYNEKWTCQERIEASLLYSVIAANSISDYREELIAMAVIYHSCVVAALNPYDIFRKIAEISDLKSREFFLGFLDRSEENKSLAAFFLKAKNNNDGEIEIEFSSN